MENPNFVFKDRRLPSHKSLTVPLREVLIQLYII